MADHANDRRFQQEVLSHLGAAYNLARWLTGSDADAEDVVQEAATRAHRFFPQAQVRDPRAWFLRIVRNSSHTFLQRAQRLEPLEAHPEVGDPAPDPEAALVAAVTAAELYAALEKLPIKHREVLVLRELEGLSYREIAAVAEIPEGTVMSRLARARAQLRHLLAVERGEPR